MRLLTYVNTYLRYVLVYYVPSGIVNIYLLRVQLGLDLGSDRHSRDNNANRDS